MNMNSNQTDDFFAFKKAMRGRWSRRTFLDHDLISDYGWVLHWSSYGAMDS